MRESSARYVEICDLPYCSEPDLFYWTRMKAGLRVRELRESASRLLEKQNDQLTVRDLKLVFLKMYPIKVNLGGDNHEVTVEKLNGRWILSCNCKSWIFNLTGDRRCKHTEHIENLMDGAGRKMGRTVNEGGRFHQFYTFLIDGEEIHVQPKDPRGSDPKDLSRGPTKEGSNDHLGQSNPGEGTKRRW